MTIDTSKLAKVLAKLYLSLQPFTRWTGIRYLCYHSVIKADHPSTEDSYYTVTERSFMQHLELIRHSNIKVISLPESLKMLEEGTAGIGQYIVITFDDGYMDNYNVAWPLLKEFGYSAHFFIVANRIGLTFKGAKKINDNDNDKMCMGYEALNMLNADGATIGSHSSNHQPLTALDNQKILLALNHSKNSLKETVNYQIDTFAYPFAAYNSRVVKLLKDTGFKYGFSVGMGYKKNIHDKNRFFIQRNIVSGSTPLDVFQMMIQGGYDWMWLYQRLKHVLTYNRS